MAAHNRIEPVIRFFGRGRPRATKLGHIFFIERYIVDKERLPSYAFENRAPGPIISEVHTSPVAAARPPRPPRHTRIRNLVRTHASGTPRSSECPHFFGVSRTPRDFLNVTQPDARVISRARLTCPFSTRMYAARRLRKLRFQMYLHLRRSLERRLREHRLRYRGSFVNKIRSCLLQTAANWEMIGWHCPMRWQMRVFEIAIIRIND